MELERNFEQDMSAEQQISAIEADMETMKDRQERMKSLCRSRDKDSFDVAYNVSKDLRNADKISKALGKDNLSLEKRLKDKAVEGKEKYNNPNTKEDVKINLFIDLIVEIDKLYQQAFSLMLENIATIRRQNEAAKRREESQMEAERKNKLFDEERQREIEEKLREEDEKKRESRMRENDESSSKSGRRKGLFGRREEKEPVVEQVFTSVREEKPKQAFDDAALKAYNERVRQKGLANEKAYQSAGMQQEQAMQMSGPSFGSAKVKEK